MPKLQIERYFANSFLSAHQGNKTFCHMREDFIGESIIETSDQANPTENEPTLDWGHWDHKSDTAPYANWYRL